MFFTLKNIDPFTITIKLNFYQIIIVLDNKFVVKQKNKF